jgi:hypothetical protein
MLYQMIPVNIQYVFHANEDLFDLKDYIIIQSTIISE